MLVSTTVVSTRILRPSTTFFSCAIATTGHLLQQGFGAPACLRAERRVLGAYRRACNQYDGYTREECCELRP